MKQEELHFHTFLLYAADLLAAAAAVIISRAVFARIPEAYTGTEWHTGYLFAALLFYSVVFFWHMDVSLPGRKNGRSCIRSIFGYSLFVMVVLYVYILRTGSGAKLKLMPLLTAITLFVCLLVMRSLIRVIRELVFSRKGFGIRTVLVTTEKQLPESLEMMLSEDAWQMHVTAILVMGMRDKEETARYIKEKKKFRTVRLLAEDDLEDYLLTHPVGVVVFDLLTDDLIPARQLMQVANRESVGIMLRQEPDTSVLRESGPHYGRIDTVDFLMHNTRRGREKMLFFKRAFDIVVGIIGSVLTIFVSIFAAPAILIGSRGPVFTPEVCVGRDGKRYKALRFRTTYTGTQLKKTLLEKREATKPGDKFEPIPRPEETAAGKWIKKLHIENFPLMFSLLKGDVSVVGVTQMTEEDFKGNETVYRKCLFSKPGLISPYGSLRPAEAHPFSEKSIRTDIEYAQNWSVWMDIVTVMDRIRSRYERKRTQA